MKANYEAFVVRNRRWITPLEDSLRHLFLLLPGRFAESELVGEGVYAALNLLAFYHRRILRLPRTDTLCCGAGELFCGASQAELYLLILSEETVYVTRVKNFLGVIRNFEVLLEMMARKHCTVKDRWTVVLGIEMVKAVCKLYLLRNNLGRMLMDATLEEAKQQLLLEEAEAEKDNRFGDLVQLYSRAGRGVHPHGHFSAQEESKRKAKIIETLAEFLYIVRPVVYAAGICMRSGQQTWSPYVTSLLTDLVSRALHSSDHARLNRQKSELRRRELLWFYYLMRSPFFERYTRHPLEKVTKQLGHLPLIGIIFTNMTDLIAALQSHHFYTSAS